MTQTIPNTVLAKIIQHRPHLQSLIDNLRALPSERQPAQEREIARQYLYGVVRLNVRDTWYLSQVANGGPWGGDWAQIHEAARITGYTEGHLRRLALDWEKEGKALKRDKTWYVRRDVLPLQRGSSHEP